MSYDDSNIFYLGEEYPEVYFTKREVECLVCLLEGHTLVSAANHLGLSHRTVEFYVKNMRLKTGTSNKVELIRRVRHLPIIKKLYLSPFYLKKDAITGRDLEILDKNLSDS